jgi:predicted nucleic acid-binding protein
MIVIVDASVAIKWAVDEDGHTDAVALIESGHEFLVPDFLLLEVGNALWKKVRRLEISSEQAVAALGAVSDTLSGLVHSWTLADRALAIGIEIDHPIYDCVYLAAAEEYGAKLVTADARLLRAAAQSSFADRITSLSEASF